MYIHEEPKLIKQLRVVKNYFERFYVILVCLLWTISTCWDIYKLQRYWFDYALELYTTFLIFLTLLYSISPKLISYNIYKSFKMITKIKGRAFLLIITSLLFFRDNHKFHRFSSFVLIIVIILKKVSDAFFGMMGINMKDFGKKENKMVMVLFQEIMVINMDFGVMGH